MDATPLFNALVDNRLSMKAKGLLCIIHNLMMETSDIKKSDMHKYSLEGKSATVTAWNELERAGYITKKRITDKGQMVKFEYKLNLQNNEKK